MISSLMMFMTIWAKMILMFELTEEERAELTNAFKDDSESGDELDDENLPLFFTGSAMF